MGLGLASQSVDDSVANATIQKEPEVKPPSPKRIRLSKFDKARLSKAHMDFKREFGFPVHGLRSEQKTLARQLMLAVLPGLGPAAAEPPKPPTREVVDGSQSQPVDGSQSQQIDWATVSVVVIDGSQSQPVVDGS